VTLGGPVSMARPAKMTQFGGPSHKNFVQTHKHPITNKNCTFEIRNELSTCK
jgi:hypothetical protein